MPVLKFEISVQNNRLWVTPSILKAKRHYGDISTYSDELPFNDVQVSGVVTLLSAIGSKIEDPTYELYEDYRKFREDQRQQWMVKEEILTPEKKINPGFREKIGKKLYDVLFRDDNVKTVLINARNDQESLLIQLAINTDNPDDSQNNSKLLYDYPWELLWEKNSSFLANDKIRFYRYIPLPSPPPELPKVQLLKVLLLFPNAEDQEHKLCKLPETKLQQLRQAIQGENRNQIRLLNLSENIITDDALQQYLNQNRGDQSPNVIHFEGHGLFGKKCVQCNRLITDNQQRICPNSECKRLLDQPQGYLLFQTDKGKPHYVSADDLGKLLVEHNHSLRLVVLSACDSSWSRGSNSVFKGVAQRLIEKGVPAVVAMQYPVLIDSATLFAEKFYASLHQRDSLADAVGNARKFMEVNGSEDQWYRPVLYMRWADNHGGQLFEKPEPVVEKKPVVEIDWHGICSDRLTSQIDQMKTPLTTGGHSPLPNSPGDPYIELNLVQRDPNKPFPRPQVQSVSPSEGVQHNLANEVSREYTHKEFFDEVLSNPDSLKKNGRPQLAIVGEPGSGKTTLLLRIAQWLLEKEKGFPIWISLKEIPVYFPEWSQKPGGLNHYLFKIWLKAAVNKNKEEWNNTKGKYQQALNELLASGKAWLFLDGANEIYGNDVIVKINNELGETTWTQVPVVLNCRLNEWEFSTNHFISNSWVYRILPYNDTQVCDYIGKRFNDKVEKKDMLVRQINNHQRLKNLAKNPLCLSMLCFILGEEENFALSSTITKADLYQEFKKKYNKLKVSSSQATSEERSDIRKIIPPQPNVQPSDPPITPSERNDLLGSIHQKLGELSLRAMQEHSPFVLKENVLNDVFCDTQSKALLKLLEHWGWLTKVNLGTVDDCFTFFHPSFQEYFAATAIPQQQDCGHFFLHHIPQNPKSPEASYRIFDSKWKEVILLWLGRKDVSLDDKRNFINELVNFNDGWENFYRYRAYFLAAEGIAEFQDCPQKQKTDIVRAVVEWSLDIFNDENKKQPGETFILPIRQTAMDVLERTDHKLVMERLNIINLDKGNDEEVKTISDFFERYPHKNTIPSPIVFEDDNARCRKIQGIIAAAQQLIQNCANYQNHPVFWQAIERLGEIGKGDHDAIEFLKDVFDQSQGNTYLHLKSALHLAAIGISEATQIGNRKIPDFFVTMINENPTSIQQKLQGYLGRIGIVDPVLSVLSRLLAFYITLTGRCDIQELIEVTSKIKTIGEYQSEGTYQTTFEELQKILPDKDYLTIIASLRQYLSSEREQEIEIPSYTPTELQTLQNLGIADYLYKTGEPSERFCDCYKTLWYCAQVMPYPEFYSAFNPESK